MTAPTPGAVLDAESVQTLKQGEKLVVILPPATGGAWASKRQPALGEIVTCAGGIPYQVCVFLEEYEPGFGWHRSRFARLARPTPEGETCERCDGHGMIGGPVGQTPESLDWVTEDCPDCTPPAQPEPGAGELEDAGHVVWWKEGGVNYHPQGEAFSVSKSCRVEPLVTRESAQAKIARLEGEVAELRAERDQVVGESLWWKAVIGGEHKPSGEVRSIKHMHPSMVKPIYEAHKGTAVADVIAGLIFSIAITENREQFLVSDANDRALSAEADAAKVREALQTLFDDYKALADSGDAGNWRLEDTDVGKQTLAVLAAQTERRA